MIRNISNQEWELVENFREWIKFSTQIVSTDPFSYQNSERRRIWITEKLRGFRGGLKILDAGAGECQYKGDCAHLDYVAQDINEYTGAGESGLHVAGWDGSSVDVVCDIVNMPFADGEFDYVICTEVLEHLPDPVAAINELARVLKSGGEMMITSPFCSLTHFAPYHYATGFSRYFYEFHLSRLGLDIIELESNGNFFEFVGQEVERLPTVMSNYLDSQDGDFSSFARDVVMSDMRRASQGDKGSDDLLSFGFHLMAKKR